MSGQLAVDNNQGFEKETRVSETDRMWGRHFSAVPESIPRAIAIFSGEDEM